MREDGIFVIKMPLSTYIFSFLSKNVLFKADSTKEYTMKQPTSSKRDTILFWVFTGLFCAFMLMNTIPNILSAPEWVEVFTQLGYPLYILPAIGVAKLLGIIALLVPGFPRIREWAYAGFFFDITGAVYSGIAVSGFDPLMLIMLVPYTLGTLSYIYHRKRLRQHAG
jgi:hypothetical protein